VLMFDEEVQGRKGDFVTFNVSQIIVDLYKFKVDHPIVHARFRTRTNEPIALGTDKEWKGILLFCIT